MRFFTKALRRIVVGGNELRTGFRYLIRGGQTLLRDHRLWPFVVVPVIINAALFALFLWGLGTLSSRFLISHLPDTWWAVVLAVFVVVASIGAIVFIGSALLVFFGSIVSAPFYGGIAERMVKALGGFVPVRPWWQGVWQPTKHAVQKFGWFLLIQAGLALLYVLPVAIGPVAYVTLGFFTTAFFLALDFLDFAFDLRGWTFNERRSWCMRRRGLVLGFGTAVFLGLAIPVVNLFIPPIAVAGATLLFHENDGPLKDNGQK